MRALGKGTIAEIIRIGLVIAWVALWISAVALVVVAIAYGLHVGGVIDLSPLFGPNTHISIDDNVIATPAGPLSSLVFVPAFLIGAVVISGGLMIVWRLRKLFDSFCS